MALKHFDITDKIISGFFAVYNVLGYGFLEKVYHNALMLELFEQGLTCEKHKPIQVRYKDHAVGEYFADIVVNNCIIIEIKASDAIAREHELQLINYLKATEFEVGLLLNFGKTPQFKRKLFTNDRKK